MKSVDNSSEQKQGSDCSTRKKRFVTVCHGLTRQFHHNKKDMDQNSGDLIVLDWDLDQDEVNSSFSEVNTLSLAQPEVLSASDLDLTIALLTKSETSDLFFSDTSDTASVSNEDQLVTFESDDEDLLLQQDNVSGCYSTINVRGR